jgi:N-acetyl-gamma-glutamyl-phosphate reductase
MATAAIIGASGYSGQETLDRVLRHPELELVALGSDSLAGEPASALDVRLNGSLPRFVANDAVLEAGADVLFVCLGHERAAALEPPADAVVVDLSGAHRLQDAALYPAWYGFEHPRAAALDGWSYALPELFPPAGELIANPGCYATAALLALAPIAEAIEPASVVVDAKSGVSGAGRELKQSSHAGFVLENVSPYRVGRHQHAPEIAQALGFPVCFVPHLLPVRRGLLATC